MKITTVRMSKVINDLGMINKSVGLWTLVFVRPSTLNDKTQAESDIKDQRPKTQDQRPKT
jgi:acyl dehydratase